MFEAMGGRRPAIQSHSDKESWAKDMDALLDLRSSGTIGDVLAHLMKTKRPPLTELVEKNLRELEKIGSDPDPDESSSIKRLRELQPIQYQEVVALDQFIDGHTPFSTKHGVKGAEYENVLVVFGRGWNKYNFNQYLEWAGEAIEIPADKFETFERNRNLFYVVCSRPMKRLAILFSQELSETALETVSIWFGHDTVNPFGIN